MKKLILAGLSGLLAVTRSMSAQAHALAVETDAVTGGIRELRIAGDESGMNWVRRADGVEFKWIGPEYVWGTGTLKVDGRPTAWSRASVSGSNVVYRLDGGLEVSCARRNEDGSLYERYSLRNGGARAVKLSEIDIHTPFRDDPYTPVGSAAQAGGWNGRDAKWIHSQQPNIVKIWKFGYPAKVILRGRC